ncbi:NlpC/P60 family protein [Hydrocarboniphaga daqingensis]|uniref:NlpC/P60 family protein n=1 Tax=Hydrocarboniphaga daqingensis TaxID=490188 RepID=A0A1M5RVE0_9GAMM|nr:NlpC/P60 family protein [Hydrocarboniphaga daqingensis]
MLHRALLIALLLTLGLLGGCANFGHRPLPNEISETRREIVLEALGQVGRPYRYGGTTPDGFDCSGLARYVYGQSGVGLPRSTSEQHAFGKTVPLKQAQPGDLLFYRFGRGRGVDHVAIYLGEGKAVHAPVNGRKVMVARVDDPSWTKRFVDVVRVIP